jgi:Kdo2-lipid IVA lauroyltransferase/acyltransferase
MIAYYILYPIIKFISLLPFAILYGISDVIFILMYYVIGYRKKVVMQNLRNSFPEKSEQEIKAIAWRFYRHFCDLFVEIIKLTSISSESINKRIRVTNPEVLEEMYSKGKSCIIATGHYGNWEWLPSISSVGKYHTFSVYKPLNNKYFDDYFIHIRSRFGLEVVPMRATLRGLLTLKKNNTLTLACLIADQSPMKSEIQHWVRFLNQDTAVYLGIEKLSQQLDMPVLFCVAQKVKRGYYNVEVKVLFENPKATAEFEITDTHTRKLEEAIIAQPEYWLWSHRRWKHRKEE